MSVSLENFSESDTLLNKDKIRPKQEVAEIFEKKKLEVQENFKNLINEKIINNKSLTYDKYHFLTSFEYKYTEDIYITLQNLLFDTDLFFNTKVYHWIFKNKPSIYIKIYEPNKYKNKIDNIFHKKIKKYLVKSKNNLFMNRTIEGKNYFSTLCLQRNYKKLFGHLGYNFKISKFEYINSYGLISKKYDIYCSLK